MCNRGGSRTTALSKMEHFLAMVNGDTWECTYNVFTLSNLQVTIKQLLYLENLVKDK